MFSVQELRFAQKYPFSKIAKQIVNESDFTVENVPREVFARARAMVNAAFTDQEYSPHIETSMDVLRNEILAFPVAKILVSIIDRLELYRKFSVLFGKVVFTNLEKEKNEVLIDMANDFGLKIYLSDPPYFVEMGLADYLNNNLDENFIQTANSEVENGRVFLPRSEFARFLSMVVSRDLRNSLPIVIKKIPAEFKNAAQESEAEFSERLRKSFSKAYFGEIAPEAFPPCMSKIYAELINGINVNHSGRFAIATFLASIGMNLESIINAFRNTPNFSEKTTRYQVERIAGIKGTGYSSPSCDKMRSYNLCVANCPVSHPVQFYSQEKSREKKEIVE